MKRSIKRRENSSSTCRKKKMKGSLATHLTVQLGQVTLMPTQQQCHRQNQSSSRFEKLLDSEVEPPAAAAAESELETNIAAASPLDSVADDKDCILSQDFFCTPDYITPDAPAILNNLDWDKENMLCPKSPEKVKTAVSKRPRLDGFALTPINSNFPGYQQVVELEEDTYESGELTIGKIIEPQKRNGYVSQSAVALRCRVMPPPCIGNPYRKDPPEIDMDPFGNQRSKFAGSCPSTFGGDGLSRYRTDFHEIEQIGNGNFSCVFKVLKRIDGCTYAVKRSIKRLLKDTDRRKALMEVQAMAALGGHENIVRYYSSWFDDDHLYIQLELCDYTLSTSATSKLYTEGEILKAMHQIAKALLYVHERGIAHLDVKPDNIYVKDGIYKLGDFGCATLIDKSLPIEEGDARYMPQEILNEKYDYLDKVDVFSLGASIYELVRGSALPEAGPNFLNLREGKLPLLPGHSMQFQNLLKVMMDADPIRRPSARDILSNPIFDRFHTTSKLS